MSAERAVAPPLPLPRYGEAALSDLVPSLLGATGLEGFRGALDVGGELRGFCLLLVDGLGYEQLLAHREAAPFLAAAAEARPPLTAVFPSTTAASLGSLATGAPPGEHGFVGYTFAVPGHDRPMNALLWELYGHGPHVSLVEELVPEEFQPLPTLLARAEAAGAEVVRVGPPPHEGSGFTRSILRGGRFVGAYFLPDVRAAVARAAREGRRPTTVYAYHPDLDAKGHTEGPGSPEWVEHLRGLDGLVADLAADLPDAFALVVTGDHGMVRLDREGRLDVSEVSALREGVRMLAGEARARHVYAAAGAQDEVLATWREVVGDRMWVASREEAIEQGWFGPAVRESVRSRIGDVVAAAHAAVGVFQRDVDPLQYTLLGHHGSMTAAEQLVPLVLVRP